MAEVSGNFNATALMSARFAEAKRTQATDATKALASGSRITSPAKDASSAALASGLKSTAGVIAQAKINANNALSVISTATGSLGQIKDILTTMDALTAKAASGDSDAKAKTLMQKEYSNLLASVTDIATRSRWNGVQLLSGGTPSLNFSAGGAAITATSAVTAVTNAFATTLAMTGFTDGTVKDITVGTAPNGQYQIDVTLVNQGVAQTFRGLSTPANSGTLVLTSTTDIGNTITLTHAAAVTAITNTATYQTALQGALMPGLNPMSFASASVDPAAAANGITPNTDIAISASTAPGEYRLSYAANSGKLHISYGADFDEMDVVDATAQTVSSSKFGISVTTAAGFAANTAFAGVNFTVKPSTSSAAMLFQVGEKSTDTLTTNFSPATGAALGIATTDVSNAVNAQTASGLLKTALQNVNAQYADLGAQMARLTQTSINLTVTGENLQAAEHNYTDADVAAEIINQQLGTIGAELANMGVGKALALNQQLLRMAQQN